MFCLIITNQQRPKSMQEFGILFAFNKGFCLYIKWIYQNTNCPELEKPYKSNIHNFGHLPSRGGLMKWVRCPNQQLRKTCKSTKIPNKTMFIVSIFMVTM